MAPDKALTVSALQARIHRLLLFGAVWGCAGDGIGDIDPGIRDPADRFGLDVPLRVLIADRLGFVFDLALALDNWLATSGKLQRGGFLQSRLPLDQHVRARAFAQHCSQLHQMGRGRCRHALCRGGSAGGTASVTGGELLRQRCFPLNLTQGK